MKSKTLALLSGITLFVLFANPIRPAAQEQRQQAEHAGHPDTGTSNPVPLINQPLVPDAVAPGGSGFTLTVNGTGFVSGSVVNWNGSALATTFVSSSQLTAAVPASDIAIASTASVTVVNPSPGGGTSNTGFLVITMPTASVAMSTTDYTFGQSPNAVAVGDFNADGILDLAVAEQPGTNTVNVLLGDGDGTFRTAVPYPTDGGARVIAVDDFNRDGKPDLAVVGDTSDTVSILLGNGDGTFQAPMTFATGSGPYYLVTGDFNRDGKQDLAIADFFDNTVSVLLGNGDGTFQPRKTFATGSVPDDIATGDFNGDGKLDLVTANAAASFSILLGNGDGTFQAHSDYPEGGNPSVTTADLNGDGRLDLAFASQNSSVISVLLGNGDGTFQSPLDYATGAGPGLVIAADINGDGFLDLVTSNPDFGIGTTVSLLLGNGDGTFQPYVDFSAGPVSGYLAAGDFEGNGRLDLAAPGLNGGVIVLLQVTGPLAVLSPTSLNFGTQLINTTSNSQTVTLRNSGIAPLDITSIAASPNFLASGTCGSSLAVGASCHLLVRFKPSGLGTGTGTLTVTDNAPGSPHTVSLSGTGTEVSLTPTSVNFGDQPVDTRAAQTVTLTNRGKIDFSISQVSITGTDPKDFGQTNTCGSTVAAGASCTFTVTFVPRTTGSRTATLNVTDTGGSSPQTVALSGTGT